MVYFKRLDKQNTLMIIMARVMAISLCTMMVQICNTQPIQIAECCSLCNMHIHDSRRWFLYFLFSVTYTLVKRQLTSFVPEYISIFILYLHNIKLLVCKISLWRLPWYCTDDKWKTFFIASSLNQQLTDSH